MDLLRGEFKELRGELIGIFKGEEKEIRAPRAEEVLGYRLYKEQEKWIEFCFKEEKKKIKMLLGARGYGKTEVITIYGVVKYIIEKLKNNPKIMILTRQQDRIRGIIRTIKGSLQEAGLKIEGTSNLIRLEKNKSKEANVMGLTINSRGIRGNHVDIVIMDDPVVALDEKSIIERTTVKNVYTECLNITKKIIVLGQPVHKEDLYAILKEIKEVDKHYSFYNSNPIPELNKDVELLRKTSTEKDIQRNFYNNLITDEMYPFSNIRVEEFNLEVNNEATIDPAFRGEDSIGLAIGRNTEEGYKIIVKKIEGDIYSLGEELIKTLEYFKVFRCYVESNDNGGVLRYLKEQESNIVFRGYKEILNKEVRIRSRIGRVKEEIVLHSESDIKEIIDWNEDVKKDDAIDALASLINFLGGNKDKVKVIR